MSIDNEMIYENKKEIWKVEQQQDELVNGKRRLENQLLQLEKELQRGFRQLSELNHEDIQQGMTNAIWMQKEYEAKQQTFQQQFHQAHEELDFSYRKTLQGLEVEREELFAERRTFEWGIIRIYVSVKEELS
ncbi:hypothetical protein [Enterococcus mundtii]|uniref:hypothetical protein n=2 Tax=Enterococcus TaxID=1350 RepID=UPI000330BAE2|nr:hypothetical protein [Enterococcus mundtii]EOH59613.1 hypothetical protein UAC_02749 [Enterococcus mundtii ATCC 882]EOU11576.1 hypothetical protein I587_00091 [Enterococcus mundtii ATCC 882]PJK27182.1 hypothetical protein CV769_00880 [Enterococcus mundtii]